MYVCFRGHPKRAYQLYLPRGQQRHPVRDQDLWDTLATGVLWMGIQFAQRYSFGYPKILTMFMIFLKVLVTVRYNLNQ
jgi:hypothetical protein